MADKSIVLTGFMAVGKSSVGRQLAKILKYKFVDTDASIVKMYNMTISDIFEKYGEEEFRKAEKRLAEKICKWEKCIISTGGGMVTNEEIISMFLENCYVVNLTAHVSKIIKNASRTDKRPLLRGKTPQQVQELMDLREKYYVKCHLRIDTTKSNIKSTALKIADSYKKEVKTNG